jgi:hypothetical protein
MEFNVSDIVSNASSYTEENVPKLVANLLIHYDRYLHFLARRVYGNDTNPVAVAAFKERSKQTLTKALTSYLFKAKAWETGRNVDAYLKVSLKRLCSSLWWENTNSRRSTLLVCPACKLLGVRSILNAQSGALHHCSHCANEISRYENDQRQGKGIDARRLALHRKFVAHSRKGYRCPECERFIPASLESRFAIICPYNDCDWSGHAEVLSTMSHPVCWGSKESATLDSEIAPPGSLNSSASGNTSSSFKDLIEDGAASVDFKILVSQNMERDLKILQSTIAGQIAQVKMMGSQVTMTQKLAMYNAFDQLTKSCPEEMVHYLVHLRQNSDSQIQVRIFQAFIRNLEDALPFEIKKDGELKEIVSISDPELNLFAGVSEFTATVKNNGSIPNNTIETYTGGREFTSFGAYFLGKLVSVTDKKTGRCLMNQVTSHTFGRIDSTIKPETEVVVKHLRVPPHYELGGMVFLQRIRRSLVDKIYYRIYGAPRPVGQTLPALLATGS